SPGAGASVSATSRTETALRPGWGSWAGAALANNSAKTVMRTKPKACIGDPCRFMTALYHWFRETRGFPLTMKILRFAALAAACLAPAALEAKPKLIVALSIDQF